MTDLAAAVPAPVRGIVMMTLSVLLLTCSDAATKWLGGTYPPGEIICLRAVFSLVLITAIVAVRGGFDSLRVVDRKGQAVRSALFALTTALIATAMIMMPIADAAAILYSGPLFITAFAAPMLGERVGWRRWTAVIVGFAGVLIMLRPGTGAFQVLGLIPLAAALSSTFRDIWSRRLAGTETHNSLMFWSSLAIVLFGALSAPFGWKAVPPADLALMAAAGSFIAIAHYMMIEAYRVAEAAIVAPFKYSALLWAVLFGFVIWGDVPDAYIVIGGAIVVASGLYILHRETRRGRVR